MSRRAAPTILHARAVWHPDGTGGVLARLAWLPRAALAQTPSYARERVAGSEPAWVWVESVWWPDTARLAGAKPCRACATGRPCAAQDAAATDPPAGYRWRAAGEKERPAPTPEPEDPCAASGEDAADMTPADAARELGVAPDAPADEVTRAFRRAALARHPDRGGEAAEFARACRARDALLHAIARSTCGADEDRAKTRRT